MKNWVFILILSMSGLAKAVDMPLEKKQEVLLALLSDFTYKADFVEFDDSKLQIGFAEAQLLRWTIFAHITASQALEAYLGGYDSDLEEFHIPFNVNGVNRILNCGLHTSEYPTSSGYHYSVVINGCRVKESGWFASSARDGFEASIQWVLPAPY